MADLSRQQKNLLGLICCDSIESGASDIQRIQSRVSMEEGHLREVVEELRNEGLLEGDGTEGGLRLTGEGRRSIKVVLAGGVFDIIHPGHIHTLSESRRFGDVLVLSVARDKTVVKMKGRPPINSENTRLELVSSLRSVDLALLGSETDIFETVIKVRPDVVALGYDQKHNETNLLDEAKKRKIKVEVVRIASPLPYLKSSLLVKNGDVLREI